jgi:hypothetical protein
MYLSSRAITTASGTARQSSAITINQPMLPGQVDVPSSSDTIISEELDSRNLHNNVDNRWLPAE